MDKKLVYIFGSQALSLTHDDVAKLRTTVNKNSGLRWILQIVEELQFIVEDYSSDTANSIPPRVLANARLLRQFLASDMLAANLPTSLPNVILTPLVVIGHLIEYTLLVDAKSTADVPPSEAFGLCTGLLSAFAIAASKDQESLIKYGAVALRLAVLIGAVVDASEGPDAAGPSRSFAAAWASTLTQEDILQIVDTMPDVRLLIIRYRLSE